jgi:NTP pyrophosphatase (non-canonical NTP hydrolase)
MGKASKIDSAAKGKKKDKKKKKAKSLKIKKSDSTEAKIVAMESKESSSRITLQGAQKLVDEWIQSKGVRYFSELTNMAILTEEVGEVARLAARRFGDQSFKASQKHRNTQKEWADELADVLWVLMALANQTGVDLEEALQRNLAKKTERDSDRHAKNEKLQRHKDREYND